MCKIIIFTKPPFASSQKKQRALFNKLLNELGKSQKDGLGIAYMGPDNVIHRRRWGASSDFKGLMTDDLRGAFCEETSEPPDETIASGFVLLHGRTATCERGLRNAHPHMIEDQSGTQFALIHNGVVQASKTDKDALGTMLSGCDSELILSAFASGGMDLVSKIITGYYAFSVIVNNRDGTSYLHVVRDFTTSLYVGEMDGGSYVFATTPDLIEMAGCKQYSRVLPLIHLTFDNTGALVDMEDIVAPKSTPYSYQGTTYPSSAGYSARPNLALQLPPPKPTIPAVPASPTMAAVASATATPASTPALIIPKPATQTAAELADDAKYQEHWERLCAANGLDNDGNPIHGKQLLQDEPPIELGEGMELAEIDAKIARAEERAKRLRLVKSRRYNEGMISRHAAMSGSEDSSTSGVSSIHSIPNSEDEAQALIQAEREAAGVCPMPA